MDLDDIPFSDWDDFDEQPRETKCRDCHAEDVYWGKDSQGRWVLYDFRTSRRHQCNAEHVTANRMDAFENLD